MSHVFWRWTLLQKHLELSVDIHLFSMPSALFTALSRFGDALPSLTCSLSSCKTDDPSTIFQSTGTFTVEKDQMKFQKWNRIKTNPRWKSEIALKNIYSFGHLWCVLIELLAVKISMQFRMKWVHTDILCNYNWHPFFWNSEQRVEKQRWHKQLITKIYARWLEDKNLQGG